MRYTYRLLTPIIVVLYGAMLMAETSVINGSKPMRIIDTRGNSILSIYAGLHPGSIGDTIIHGPVFRCRSTRFKDGTSNKTRLLHLGFDAQDAPALRRTQIGSDACVDNFEVLTTMSCGTGGTACKIQQFVQDLSSGRCGQGHEDDGYFVCPVNDVGCPEEEGCVNSDVDCSGGGIGDGNDCQLDFPYSCPPDTN